MVYARNYIPRMEERIAVVAPWKSYTSPAILTLTAIDPFFNLPAGAGKSIMWYAASLLFLWIEYSYNQ